MFLLRIVIFLALGISPPLHGADAPEAHVRGGWPNIAAKIARGDEVRVAFLGGSITAADGWRVFIIEHLRREFAGAKFTEIFAAVSGTGSSYGAPRLSRDVLRHHPDLVGEPVGTKPPRAELPPAITALDLPVTPTPRLRAQKQVLSLPEFPRSP